jgi:hypothetical protein
MVARPGSVAWLRRFWRASERAPSSPSRASSRRPFGLFLIETLYHDALERQGAGGRIARIEIPHVK